MTIIKMFLSAACDIVAYWLVSIGLRLATWAYRLERDPDERRIIERFIQDLYAAMSNKVTSMRIGLKARGLI